MAGWTAAAIVGGAYLGSQASKSAGEMQAGAAREASALSNEQFQQTRQDQMPFLQAGVRALGKLESASDYTPFGMDQFNADPGYAFRLKEGQKALDAQAAARGGLISGNALRAAVGFGQEMGSQEYQNAFNRYQSERASRLAPLQSLAGVGQTTAANLGATGAANANTMGNYLTGGAASEAAGRVGAANAYTSGLGTYLNYNQGNNLVAALNRNRTAPTPSSINYYGNSGGYENLDF
jgi:hypothetical protein